MLSSMTAKPRAGLTTPVSTGRSPRTIAVRKVPHRTTHGYLMRLREKHPGFTFSLPSSSVSERREIEFWPARQGVWCGAGADVGRSCVARGIRGGSWRELAWLPGPKPPGARLLEARLLGVRLLGLRLLGARLLGARLLAWAEAVD